MAVCHDFIITSVFAILLTPLGNALAADLYAGVDKNHAFKVRGFVGSVNTILAPVLSGFVIYYLSRQQILFLCLSVALLSLYAFSTIKLPKVSTNTADTHAVNVLKVLLFNPIERIMATVSAVANFSVTPILAYVIPYKISQEFSLPVLYVGISEGFFGLGMIMGSAWLLAVFNHYLGKHHTVAVSTVLFALGIVMTALSQNVAVLVVSMFVLGLVVVMFNINSTAIRCTATPKALTQSFEFVFLAVCIIPIPLGVMATTWALSGGYLLWLYMATAVIVLLLSGVIYFHQQIKQVYRLTADKLPNFYQRQYPKLYVGVDTAQP
ncbi:MFS transporter [Moraxella cuniculi]|uniref:H+ Antiporter protein n=1 Tax=Moraxella cuniculi TaxID=34061 RepID=A0A448GUZ0_9GAMM|nr:MFS transporter [Moraxella cuniculi]VEG12596.1 H+ Antiporter protein [Moraxella cuniculi]